MTKPVVDLTLAQEVVLLTLASHRRRVAHALKLAGQPELGEVTGELESRGLLNRRVLQRPKTKSDASAAPARRHLNTVLNRTQTPTGADAELLLLVAYAGGLETVSAADHLRARHQIAALGSKTEAPHLLDALCQDQGVDSAKALASKLLPGRVHVKPGELDPGVTSAIWGGGHGGGTLG